MELRVQQQHGCWDVESSYASYEVWRGGGTRLSWTWSVDWREGKPLGSQF